MFLPPFELAGFEAALPRGKIGVTLEGVTPEFSPFSSPASAGCLAFPGSVDRGYREAVTERRATQARRVGSVPPQLSEKTRREKKPRDARKKA